MKRYPHLRQEVELGSGKRVLISPATQDDVLRIRWLYHRVYGGSYPFSLVYDPRECSKAIESDRYLWFLAREGEQVVGSVIFTVDHGIFLGKVFGGVVAEEFRGHNLMERMLAFGLDIIVRRLALARSVYSTTRTVNLAPQRLVEKAGFLKLGVFPNAHKVQRSETHTLAVYYGEGVLEGKRKTPRLPLILKSFFSIVRRETGLPDAEYLDLSIPADDRSPETAFEVIQAPQFILRRFQEVKAKGGLLLDFFPFHEPNLLLLSPDGKTEIYVYRSTKDGHCVLNGARSANLPVRSLLDHGANFLEGMGVRYLEALIDACDAETLAHALGARFLPSAYYPAMRWDAKGRDCRDYVVVSRSLAVLDFKGIKLQPAYADYLREYFKLWRELHVGQVLP